jgi:hypothetical protein
MSPEEASLINQPVGSPELPGGRIIPSAALIGAGLLLEPRTVGRCANRCGRGVWTSAGRANSASNCNNRCPAWIFSRRFSWQSAGWGSSPGRGDCG